MKIIGLLKKYIVGWVIWLIIILGFGEFPVKADTRRYVPTDVIAYNLLSETEYKYLSNGAEYFKSYPDSPQQSTWVYGYTVTDSDYYKSARNDKVWVQTQVEGF